MTAVGSDARFAGMPYRHPFYRRWQAGLLMGAASLRFQIVAMPLLLLALWLAVALAAMIYDARQRVADEVASGMALAHAMVETSLSGMEATADPAASLVDFGRRLPRTRHVRMAVSTDGDGAALASLFLTPQDEAPAPAWFVALIAPRSPVEMVQLAVGGRWFGRVAIAPNPADEIREIWQDFCFLSGICAALVLVIVGSVQWMIRRALRPLRALTDGLARLEGGDFTASIAPIRVSELAGIGDRFNSLAQSLDRTIEDNRMLCRKLTSLREASGGTSPASCMTSWGPCLFALRVEAACIVDASRRRRAWRIGAAARAVDPGAGRYGAADQSAAAGDAASDRAEGDGPGRLAGRPDRYLAGV